MDAINEYFSKAGTKPIYLRWDNKTSIPNQENKLYDKMNQVLCYTRKLFGEAYQEFIKKQNREAKLKEALVILVRKFEEDKKQIDEEWNITQKKVKILDMKGVESRLESILLLQNVKELQMKSSKELNQVMDEYEKQRKSLREMQIEADRQKKH
jgi:hypothetical protein